MIISTFIFDSQWPCHEPSIVHGRSKVKYNQ
jgi:hypothetical protein